MCLSNQEWTRALFSTYLVKYAMAVIKRTECELLNCIRNRTMIQGFIGLLVLGMGAHAGPLETCDVARPELARLGFSGAPLLERPGNGQICGSSSCCSFKLEQEMVRGGHRQVEAFLTDSVSKLSSLIDIRAKKFDVFFRTMMNTSKLDFHQMFQKTYGKIYLQNSDVFSDFFSDLETYYKKGSLRLSDTLDNFFGILYQRMFTVINSQYTFDDKYLECASEHMVELGPFGDVPHKLTMQLRRSFVATRTYYKALSAASDLARKLMDIRIDEECDREVVKMQFCGSCKGERGNGVCADYCSAVMEVCLRHHIAFSTEWDNIIDALDKVADRLMGPYNIEMVVEPLNIKISEAVMNMQENGVDITKKIFERCGKPALGRRRRDASPNMRDTTNPSYEIKHEPIKMHHKKKKTKKVEEEDSEPSFEKIIKEIKMKVHETRQFWAHLPYHYCNNASITAPASDGYCWNGSAIGTYNKTGAKLAPSRNPILHEQIFSLQVYTDKLRKAHQGDEVEIVDDTDDSSDGSGSGSGDFGIDEEQTVEKEPPTEEPEVEEPEEELTTRKSGPEVKTASAGAPTMSLSRALAQYLLPIVLVWFGGAIADLL